MTTAVWVGYPERAGPDGPSTSRRTGRGRHLPGDHLAQLHGAGASDPRRPSRPSRDPRAPRPRRTRPGRSVRCLRFPEWLRARARRPRRRGQRRAHDSRDGHSPAPVPAQPATAARPPAAEPAPATTERAPANGGGSGGGTTPPTNAPGGRRAGSAGGGTGSAGGGNRSRRRRRRRRYGRRWQRWHRRGRHRRTIRAGAQALPAAEYPVATGRDRNLLPAAQKRHGSSAALVIPMRRSTATSTPRHPRGRPENTIGPSVEVAAVVLELDRERLRQLARPRAQVLGALDSRAGRASPPTPSSGSSARISTAAPTPSGSLTAFSSAWIPYERYT